MEKIELNLIKEAKKGNAQAFEKLIKQHEQKIYNLLLKMTNNRVFAEDLFQETFLTVWKKIKSFKGNSEFSTWLYRIAVNTVLMKHRKKTINSVSFDTPILTSTGEIKRDFGDDWSKNPLATLENKELKEELNKAIKSLPDKYRTVLVLRDIEYMSNEEVRKILKISIPSVKSRLHRARLFLRDRISKYFKGHK
ncbi:MAG: hypothetical protein A2474_06620 [Elusimicrobia bacterium RIFOXYC2_FULL_34_12]|nr:MAG: hypothetical protein A2474_06620 [Elusimicrobia bacterium RIFOXYC2_FULL_34_12]OGS39279.1 MAG: hypothetical protein A2551_06865 [Elusimicrobia bacterium RIFOXYD2_FULL_34_30]HAM38812.1 RNA polymerase subunit sigma-24 [Elusimicrobiota bacterium]